MLAATAIIVVGILSVTVLFKVTQMLIEGECKYTVQELKIAGGIEEEENLIRIDARAAEEAILKKLVYIDSVKVRKDFPSTITFVVSNAVPEAELLSGGKYYSISSKGRILQEKTNHEKNLVVFEGMDPSVLPETGGYIDFDDPEGGKLIKILMENIKESGLKEVKSVNIKDRMDIIINYADRVMMRIGSTVQLSEKLSAAKILITNEIDQNEHVMLLLNNPEKVASRSLNSMSDEIKTQAQTSETIEDSEENYENTESAETQQPVTE